MSCSVCNVGQEKKDNRFRPINISLPRVDYSDSKSGLPTERGFETASKKKAKSSELKIQRKNSRPAGFPWFRSRDVVIFPYMMAPFLIGRESSVSALEEALAWDRKIFLATQHDATIDEPEPDEIFHRDHRQHRSEPETARRKHQVLVEGTERGEYFSRSTKDGYMSRPRCARQFPAVSQPQVFNGYHAVGVTPVLINISSSASR